MKTKELIRLLQEEDPTGETECCVGNTDIFFVERLPAYYDGRLELLVRDSTKRGYDIVGAKIVGCGYKINIRTLPIDSALFEDPDLPVDLNDWGGVGEPTRYEKWIEAARESARTLHKEVEEQCRKGYGLPTGEGIKPIPAK